MLRTQGRRGEVAAELYTGSIERFRGISPVFALDPHGRRRELQVEDFWPHKGLVILKFRGVGGITHAESLIGCEIQVPRDERLPLPPGEVYVSDLIGTEVFDRGKRVGRVADVQFGSGDAPLLVVKSGNKEHLIPFAEAFLIKVNVKGKQLELKLPEGLLGLDH